MIITTAAQAVQTLYRAHAFAFDRSDRVPNAARWTISAALDATKAAWPGVDTGAYVATAADLDALWMDLADVHEFLVGRRNQEAFDQYLILNVAASIVYAASEAVNDARLAVAR